MSTFGASLALFTDATAASPAPPRRSSASSAITAKPPSQPPKPPPAKSTISDVVSWRNHLPSHATKRRLFYVRFGHTHPQPAADILNLGLCFTLTGSRSG